MTKINTRLQTLAAVCASTLFVLLGAAMIPFAGVQDDEALFGVPLYLYNDKWLSIRIHHHDIPLMVMSYVGTLKTLLYSIIFRFWHVTVWSVRLPMVLAGALTIFLLCRLTSRAESSFAGVAAAFLLATDATFLVTNTFDWGPVALGHLLVVAACYSLVLFHQRNYKMRYLAQGFFFLGLGLWNKALMFWVLGGLAAGALVLWPEVRRNLTWRNIRVAAGAFILGSLPFIVFNIHHRNQTLGENFHFETATLSQTIVGKGGMVQSALNGSGLFGFIPLRDWVDHARPPVTRRGKVAQWIRGKLGEHEQSGFDWVFLAAVAAVPLWWRKRSAWFALIFMTTTWAAMAITRGAGGAIHHSVLLWPIPEFFVAIVFAALPWRKVAIAGVALCVFGNLLVVNEYIADLDRNGESVNFSDALLRLSESIPEHGEAVYVTDWGIGNTLGMMHEGRLAVRSAIGLFQPDTPNPEDRPMIKRILNEREALFVDHVDEREVLAGINGHLDREAKALGLKKVVMQVVEDSHGRPVFQIFRFE